MKTILRIYDFIKSWVYYPKMKRYLINLGIDYEKYGENRLKYSFGIAEPENFLILDTRI